MSFKPENSPAPDYGLSFGDGKIGVDLLLNDKISWLTKVFWQACSNGCFQPEHFLEEIKARFPNVDNIEEIAKLAFIEYSKQNLVYGLMKQWALQKKEQTGDARLYDDLVSTNYPRPKDLKFEKDHVPAYFSNENGVAFGLARDPAFFIAQRVARILNYKLNPEAIKTYYARALDILELQVAKSNTVDELYTNFTQAMRDQKKSHWQGYRNK